MNNQRDRTNKSKRDLVYNPSTTIEQDEVIQLCLPSDKNANKIRKTHSVSSKGSDDKQVQQPKKSNKPDKIKTSSIKPGKRNESLPRDFNENLNEPHRTSHSSRTQHPKSDITLRKLKTDCKKL